MLGLIIFAILILCIGVRFYYSIKNKGELSEIECARIQKIGDEEVQADALYSNRTNAGVILVAADGIGKQNIGMICSSIAIKTIQEIFMSYDSIEKPRYFITIAIQKAHESIKLFLDGQYGGASIGCGFIKRNEFYYGIVGKIDICLYRNNSLIPLTEGQTLDVLAKKSFEGGNISREMAIRATGEKRIYNFAGQESFQPIELCQIPIRLQERDLLLFFTKGLKDVLSESELRECISDCKSSAYEKISDIQLKYLNCEVKEKQNASVLLVQINHWKG